MNRIAVCIAYEWHDDPGSWFSSYGNTNWEFDQNGLIKRHIATINDLPINEGDRKYYWPRGDAPTIIRACLSQFCDFPAIKLAFRAFYDSATVRNKHIS